MENNSLWNSRKLEPNRHIEQYCPFYWKAVRILNGLVFGDIHNVSSAINKGQNWPTLKPRSRPKGSSFSTTVTSVEKSNATAKGIQSSTGRRKFIVPSAKKDCPFSEGRHNLEFCPRLEKGTHAEKITILREKGYKCVYRARQQGLSKEPLMQRIYCVFRTVSHT